MKKKKKKKSCHLVQPPLNHPSTTLQPPFVVFFFFVYRILRRPLLTSYSTHLVFCALGAAESWSDDLQLWGVVRSIFEPFLNHRSTTLRLASKGPPIRRHWPELSNQDHSSSNRAV